jgi:NAD(P)-dependent dehydrogenase (short-subunit alcohol dehydrogenase family)
VFALAFAGEGARVVVNDLGTGLDGSGTGRSPADEVVAEIGARGGEAVANYDSVTTAEGGESIIRTCVDSFGKIDILVNNAGILRDRMIHNMSPEEWDSVIKVHLYGAFNCTRPAAVLMRRQGSGRIINITSPTALGGMPGQANYGAAKAGILGFTRVISRELGRSGITVNAFCPVAATRMTDTLGPEARKRMPSPEDNAAIIVFLASDAAADYNGQTIGCNGGQITLYTPGPAVVRSIHKDGRWTVEELLRVMPSTLGAGMVNPAPPRPTE